MLERDLSRKTTIAETDVLRFELGNRAADALKSAEGKTANPIIVWEEADRRHLSKLELGERVTAAQITEEVMPVQAIENRVDAARMRAARKNNT